MLIQKVTDASFVKYGKVIEGLDVSDIIEAMGATPCPDHVIYVPGDAALEACKSAADIEYTLYGGMPIQIGYCNGNNKKLNGLEYHRDSEINIAVTDLILLIGMEQDIVDGQYDTSKVEAFLVPAGTTIEVYATTLHYAPCTAVEGGFKCVVVLPKGTNTGLEKREPKCLEDKMLFARNKWLLVHPEAAAPGQFVGLVGENITLD
ncbi:MAG: DUF4867 family protein [Clostridia bacterium]|nr:DUF4867 family protein [Clostridia bacterium]